MRSSLRLLLLFFVLLLSLSNNNGVFVDANNVIQLDWEEENNVFDRNNAPTSATATVTFQDVLSNLERITVRGLNDGTTANGEITFEVIDSGTRTTSTGGVQQEEHVWYGEVAIDGGGAEYCSLMQKGNTTTLTGSFSTSLRTYGIDTMPDGTIRVRAANWDDVQSDDPVDMRRDINDVIINNFTSVGNNFDQIITTGPQQQQQQQREAVKVIGTIIPDSTKFTMNGRGRRGRRRHRKLQADNVIDLMFLVTHDALCEFLEQPGCDASSSANQASITPRIEAVRDLTNQVYANSQISTEFNVVAVVFIAQDYDVSSATLSFMASDATILQLRQTHYPDLVAMLPRTRSANGCGGIGSVLGSFSVTEILCTSFSLVFQHEIGHNCGGLHNREDHSGAEHAYSHGYRDEANGFRTIMSYACLEGACSTQIAYFSSSTIVVDGHPIGDATRDVARYFRETSPTVAAFVTAPPPNTVCVDDADWSLGTLNCESARTRDTWLCPSYGHNVDNGVTLKDACCWCGGGTHVPVTPAPGTAVTPAPITPAPVTPAPITPAPITPAPITPAPITPAPITPAPVATTPSPVAATTPAPVATTPAPVATTPAPVATTPAPVATTPAPVAVTPAPVTTAPVTPAPTSSRNPTRDPSSPTAQPSAVPSLAPTAPPSGAPSAEPSGGKPSGLPSATPTGAASARPSPSPSTSKAPSNRPTRTSKPSLSSRPTSKPNEAPSSDPTAAPSQIPTLQPSSAPTPEFFPSLIVTLTPFSVTLEFPDGATVNATELQTTIESYLLSRQTVANVGSISCTEIASLPSVRTRQRQRRHRHARFLVQTSTYAYSAQANLNSAITYGQASEVQSSQMTALADTAGLSATVDANDAALVGSPAGATTTVTATTTASASPSGAPSQSPSKLASSVPTSQPTGLPSENPTALPTGSPSWLPSQSPTATPTTSPSGVPSMAPSKAPSPAPVVPATPVPVAVPATPAPVAVVPATPAPVAIPATPAPVAITPAPVTPATNPPTKSPSSFPSPQPSPSPTQAPTTPEPTTPVPTTGLPSRSPSMAPSKIVLCQNCKRLFRRVRKRVAAGSVCINKCKKLPTVNEKLFIPDPEGVCDGLCTAMERGHKAKRACIRRTTLCVPP